VVVSFIGGGNQNTGRKPVTCCMSIIVRIGIDLI
jgi:hypothetical protein